MKGIAPSKVPLPTVTVTISLTYRLRVWAGERCDEKAYANFSGYIAALIRRACPMGGTYTINLIDVALTCSIQGHKS
jgi:hypothetical protein